MPGFVNELFLLTINLARLRDRGLIIKHFAEALSAARQGLSVRFIEPGSPAPLGALALATPEHDFGYVLVDAGTSELPLGELSALRNAVFMLAVVLENRLRAERLESENARLDAAIAERTAALAQTAAELQDLYDHAPCGYHSLGPDGSLLRVNETEARWLGYSKDQLVGLRMADLVAPDDQAAFAEAFERFRAAGTLKDQELELVRQDGSRLPVVVNATAVRDEQGAMVMARSTLLDLTERRQADAQLHEVSERARQAQKLEAVGRLAGSIAHDFNNLLTIILGASTFLQDGLGPADPRLADVRDVRDAAERGAVLTRQLLAFSRRQSAQPAVLDLNQVVENLRMVRRLIGEDIEFTTRLARPLGSIFADVGQLEQVIVNLVVNARDAMPEGGKLSIETAEVGADEARRLALAGKAWVMLAVGDTGTGMDEATLARLFEPFFTTKEAGKGTGLGLATVYGIVRGAGGEVRVDSHLGQGSQFRIYLPRVEASAPVASPAAAEMTRGSGTVLLVEDEPAVRELAMKSLKAAGYRVLEARDGERALALAQAVDSLQLLVTDVVMPRMSGLALTQVLRKARPRLPVLYMSGYPDRSLVEEGSAFLQKPFTPVALAAAVDALLSSSGR
jgi:two-component system, cell cycle sensor histidine kinase and response regulator CckA